MAFRMFQLLFLHPPPKLELNSEIGINLLGANFSIFTFFLLYFWMLKIKGKEPKFARKEIELRGPGTGLDGIAMAEEKIICFSHLWRNEKLPSVDLMAK